jgi:lysophospholipase L1-like esterase
LEELTMTPTARAVPFALVFAFAALAAGAPDDSPLKPVPRSDNPVWGARHAALLERAKKGADVVFLGDAVTQGWEGPDGAEAWKKHFEPLKTANFGAGGDRIEHLLWRVTEGGELNDLKPKVLVLEIGGGNLVTNSAEDLVAGLGNLLKKLARLKPDAKVLLLGLLPRGAKADDKFRDKIKEVNKGLAGLADGKKVRYLDAADKFLDKDGNLSEEAMPDTLHLSPRGYAILSEAIKGPLEEMLH